MLSDVTLGQYYPTQSFVHKMDAAIKLLLLVVYIVIIFLIKNFYGFIVAGSLIVVMTLCSKVPITSVLKSVKAILFVIILTAIMNLFFYTTENEHVIFSWWKISITKEALYFAAFMALRLTLLIMGTSLLTLTTSPVALTDGIEVILFPLKLIKFPVHDLALIMSIALRFIPTLLEETDRIMSAQKARGADFESGNLFKRIKALVPVLIPLLVSSFKRAEELGDAMDSRCYSGSKGRTKYKKNKIGVRDVIGVLVFAVATAMVVYLNGAFARII